MEFISVGIEECKLCRCCYEDKCLTHIIKCIKLCIIKTIICLIVKRNVKFYVKVYYLAFTVGSVFSIIHLIDNILNRKPEEAPILSLAEEVKEV